MVAKKRAEISRLRGVERVMSQYGKFEFDALVDLDLVPPMLQSTLGSSLSPV